MNFKYCKGTQNSDEIIELIITESDGKYITTCVINVNLLLCGVQTFTCINGDKYKLEKGWYMEALRFLQGERMKLLEEETVKSLDGWRRSGLRNFDEYFFVGDEVEERALYAYERHIHRYDKKWLDAHGIPNSLAE